MGMQTYKKSSNNKFIHLDGVDFVSRLTVKPFSQITTAKDAILVNQPISASSFKGTRLSSLSQNWERYRWTNCTLEYVPSVPNTIACQLVAYIDTDPNDDPTTITDTDTLVRQAVAQMGSRQWNFNQRMSIPLVMRKDDQLYYTGDDKQNRRFNLQGVLYIIQVSNLIDFNGVAVDTAPLICGSLYIKWGCDFAMNQINPEFLAPAPNVTLKFVTTITGSGPVLVGIVEPNKQYIVMVTGLTVSTDAAAGTTTTDNFTLLDNNGNTIMTLEVGVDNLNPTTAPGSANLAVNNAAVIVESSDNGNLILNNPTETQCSLGIYTFDLGT